MTGAVLIRGIAAGGDGVGRLDDGMAVFVPRTAPGDLVEVAVTDRRERYARARALRIADPGPARVDPPCPHYVRDRCGGCQLQHLGGAAQLEAKAAIVREALRRIGRVELPDVEIVPAATPWRYRSKITLATDAGGRLGLHPWDRPAEVFPLDDCLIATPPLMALWSRIAPHRACLPPTLTHLVLREDRAGGLHVLVRGGEPPWDPAALVTALDGPGVTLWWEPTGGAPRVVSGDQTGFPATAFAQVQPALGDRIRADAIGSLGDVAGQVVWDLYGGTGDGARALAGLGALVWSVDTDRFAVAWARRQSAPAGAPPGSPRYLAGRVEDVLHRLPNAAAVVLNPPRAGAARRVLTALDAAAEKGEVGRAAYVSCDPATLARDLSRLTRYRVVSVRAYDLFPQTSHVETVVALAAR